jgi:phage terminase small subunit
MPGVKGRSGGHNAKTVGAHKLQGTFQKVRHGSIRNPEPPSGAPERPKEMQGDAAEEWDRMLDRLRQSKTLSGVDGGALYQYCQMFAETEALVIRQLEISASVDILEESLGDFKGPELLAAFQELTKMRKLESGYTSQIRQGRMGQRVFLVEFGLTPASRGRVKIPDQKPEKDEWDELDATTIQ